MSHVIPFPSHPLVDGDDYDPLSGDPVETVPPAPFHYVTDAEVAQMEAARHTADVVIAWLMVAAIFMAGAVCGLSLAVGIQHGWL